MKRSMNLVWLCCSLWLGLSVAQQSDAKTGHETVIKLCDARFNSMINTVCSAWGGINATSLIDDKGLTTCPQEEVYKTCFYKDDGTICAKGAPCWCCSIGCYMDDLYNFCVTRPSEQTEQSAESDKSTAASHNPSEEPTRNL